MPKISIFENISEVKNPEIRELMSVLEGIRDGEWMNETLDCRNCKTDEEQAKFKKTVPTITFSGEFDHRKDSEIKKHSEFIAIDLDDLENPESTKKKLADDKYIFACFVSIGGKGLRPIFKIDPKKHKESFDGIREHLFQEHGITTMSFDSNGRNVSKPYLVSWDPLLYLNFGETTTFRKYLKETVIKRMPDFVHTHNDFEAVIKQITGRNIQIYESYNDWLKIGFGLAEEFGETGRSYYHDISRNWDKYNIKDVNDQYKQCLKARGQKKATIATVYYLAQKNGVSIATEQTKKIIRTTKNGKRSGLDEQQIIINLKKFENIEGADELVKKIFTSDEYYEDKEEESILPILEMYISNNYDLKMNEVTGYLEQNEVSLTPSDLNSMFIACKKIIPRVDYPLMLRLLKSNFIEHYNPFFKFFGSDGIPVTLPAIPVEQDMRLFPSPLIDKLCACIINDNPAYTVYFTRKWLVSIISAMHKVHSPLLHALLGPPETGKTEWYRRLLPLELQIYYAESKLDKEKDDEILMTENILILDDELSGKSKTDANKLKNITSKQHFSLRRPYGDHNEKILRLAVLCGTSNILAINADPTPNRRIIPIQVFDINRELYNSVNKRDLFIECFKLYKMGFDWRVTRVDMPILNKDQDEYEIISKEKELLLKYYRPGSEHYMTTSEIIVELDDLTKQKLSLNIMGQQLTKLGFMKKTMPRSEGGLKKWIIDKINRKQDLFEAPDSF